MKIKILNVFIAVIIVFVSLCSCDNIKIPAILPTTEQHVHSFGEWVVVNSPTLKQPGTKERSCSCGEKETVGIPSKFDELADFVAANAYNYSNGSYTVRGNANTFGNGCRLIYPGYTVDGGGWNISLTYTPSSQYAIFLISYGFVESSLSSFAFSVQDGVIVDRYEYLFQDQNFMGGYTDQISGSFSVSTLNSLDRLTYTLSSKGSGKAFDYFVDGYQKDACAYAKQLAIFFDAYFKYNGLSIRMSDFGFK